MPSRITYPGTIAASDPITASNNNKLPGGAAWWGQYSGGNINIDNTGYTLAASSGTLTFSTNRIVMLVYTAPTVSVPSITLPTFVKLQAQQSGTSLGTISSCVTATGGINAADERVSVTGMWIAFTTNGTLFEIYAKTGDGSTGNTTAAGHISTSNTDDPGPSQFLVVDLGPSF
jgi:hypothetical protein